MAQCGWAVTSATCYYLCTCWLLAAARGPQKFQQRQLQNYAVQRSKQWKLPNRMHFSKICPRSQKVAPSFENAVVDRYNVGELRP
eukprot:3562885-Amphidinium_carterae.1